MPNLSSSKAALKRTRENLTTMTPAGKATSGVRSRIGQVAPLSERKVNNNASLIDRKAALNTSNDNVSVNSKSDISNNLTVNFSKAGITRTGSSNIIISVRIKPIEGNQRDGFLEGKGAITIDADNKSRIEMITEMGTGAGNAMTSDAASFNPGKEGINGVARTHTRAFAPEHVFTQSSDQAQVYNQCAKELVLGVTQGVNCAILAYGQTGSGKTHTMLGDPSPSKPELNGIIPRAIADLFHQLDHIKAVESSLPGVIDVNTDLKASYVEIYQEQPYDLLALAGLEADGGSKSSNNNSDPRKILRIREDIEQDGFFLEDVRCVTLRNEKHAMDVLSAGFALRRTASTTMNSRSSRSHAVLTLHVDIRIRECIDGHEHIRTRSAVLDIVDLAGSERQRDTGAEGSTIKEAGKINNSLGTLADVVKACVDNQNARTAKNIRPIPWRNSKLTMILKRSLSGNSRTAMIFTISPALDYWHESVNTLLFADRARKMKTEPSFGEKVTIVGGTAGQVAVMAKEIERLRAQLMNGGVPSSTAASSSMYNPLELARNQVNKLQLSPSRLGHWRDVQVDTDQAASEMEQQISAIAEAARLDAVTASDSRVAAAAQAIDQLVQELSPSDPDEFGIVATARLQGLSTVLKGVQKLHFLGAAAAASITEASRPNALERNIEIIRARARAGAQLDESKGLNSMAAALAQMGQQYGSLLDEVTKMRQTLLESHSVEEKHSKKTRTKKATNRKSLEESEPSVVSALEVQQPKEGRRVTRRALQEARCSVLPVSKSAHKLMMTLSSADSDQEIDEENQGEHEHDSEDVVKSEDGLEMVLHEGGRPVIGLSVEHMTMLESLNRTLQSTLPQIASECAQNAASISELLSASSMLLADVALARGSLRALAAASRALAETDAPRLLLEACDGLAAAERERRQLRAQLFEARAELEEVKAARLQETSQLRSEVSQLRRSAAHLVPLPSGPTDEFCAFQEGGRAGASDNDGHSLGNTAASSTTLDLPTGVNMNATSAPLVAPRTRRLRVQNALDEQPQQSEQEQEQEQQEQEQELLESPIEKKEDSTTGRRESAASTSSTGSGPRITVAALVNAQAQPLEGLSAAAQSFLIPFARGAGESAAQAQPQVYSSRHLDSLLQQRREAEAKRLRERQAALDHVRATAAVGVAPVPSAAKVTPYKNLIAQSSATPSREAAVLSAAALRLAPVAAQEADSFDAPQKPEEELDEAGRMAIAQDFQRDSFGGVDTGDDEIDLDLHMSKSARPSTFSVAESTASIGTSISVKIQAQEERARAAAAALANALNATGESFPSTSGRSNSGKSNDLMSSMKFKEAPKKNLASFIKRA